MLTVRVYIPLFACVVFVTTGFLCVEVNPLGPTHKKVIPVGELAIKNKLSPSQILVVVAVGIAIDSLNAFIAKISEVAVQTSTTTVTE